MKSKPTTKKLVLKKETIAELKSVKMNEIKGGASLTTICYFSCIAVWCKEDQ